MPHKGSLDQNISNNVCFLEQDGDINKVARGQANLNQVAEDVRNVLPFRRFALI